MKYAVAVRLVLLPILLCGSLAQAGGFGTDVKGAFASAKKSGKPLLIDFFGIWCPPCNELDETVFESRDFLMKAKSFELLKVDADAESAWAVKDRYRVGGYPTVVFTTPSGEEIFRIVGYRTPREFLRIMDMVLSAKNEGLKKSCGEKSADALWRCALVCTERKDSTCADKAYRKLETLLKPETVRYQLARAYFVENTKGADLKRDGYERLLKEFPGSPLALVWSDDYLSQFDDAGGAKPKKELVEQVLTHYDKMLSDPKSDELGLAPTDLAEMKADILEKLGKADDAKAAWKAAAQNLEKAAADLSTGKAERGFSIERIGVLQNAGEADAALKLANDYRLKYPDEFTFHFWAARILRDQKKYSDAIPPARRAYELSYGDNRIRVATLLLGLLETVPDRAGAKTVYDAVKAQYQPDAKLEIRTHRYLKQLDQAWSKFR